MVNFWVGHNRLLLSAPPSLFLNMQIETILNLGLDLSSYNGLYDYGHCYAFLILISNLIPAITNSEKNNRAM